MRISAQSLSIYANGKSPFVGLPVVDDGGRRPALFLRKHFAAAIGGGVTFAKYDHEKLTLTVRGVRSAYTLRDLSANSNDYPLWQVKATLAKWAGSKRKTAQRKALPANERLTAKQNLEIGKLERRAAKIHVHKPVNPCAIAPRERWDGSRVWMRDNIETWAKDRAARRGLGKLYGKYYACLSRPRGKFPWAEITKDIEALGLRLDSHNAWAKVRTRKANRGMDIPEYMKSLPVFVSGLSRKPWDLQPVNFAERMESSQQSKQGYLSAVRELKFIQDQIANVRAVNASL
jgi:hypothetical protein